MEGDSVDLTIMIETNDGMNLNADTDVILRISDDVGSTGNPAIDLDRLQGDISLNGDGDPIVTLTVPAGTQSSSTVQFTGITIMNNDVMENTDLEFLVFIDGFSLLQTSGGGISGFTGVIVEDDDDGMSVLNLHECIYLFMRLRSIS